MNWRRTRDYRQWRIAVIRRDKCCTICGSRKRRTAHHLDNGAHHPDGRFDVDNGICLCNGCHTNFHTNFKRSFRTKCTRYDMANFLQLVEYIRSLEKDK